MFLVDEIRLQVSAGRGGDGVVRWLHLKGKDHSGPAGGNGGDGGGVYISAIRDLYALGHYNPEKALSAKDGSDGEAESRHGKKGSHLTIELPVGSVVVNRSTGEQYELLEEGQTYLILKGGRGGAGNAVFKSSVNRSPDQSFPGQAGESAEIDIELRLIADAGFIGLPNAGKTSLLNALTGATGKIGSYAFTTLNPHLGVFYNYVLADIPGVIEGAAEGKGLGITFLRHIARTRILLHCVSLESETPLDDWRTVRKEIEQYQNGALKSHREIIVLTKSDTRDVPYIKDILESFNNISDNRVLNVSVIDDVSLDAFKRDLSSVLAVNTSL